MFYMINAYLARRLVTALSNESAYFTPSLMKNEDMHCRTKSALVDLIIQANNKINKRSNVTCTIVDVAALVRKIRPHISEFINQELLPNIVNRFLFANRLDVVFDQYHSKSIKTRTRLDRRTKPGKS